MEKFAKEANQSGQMLLVVVLTMIVSLTVGLSLVSRTITNLKISRQNEESQRAFQAAEAGIEKALQSSSESAKTSFSNNASYTTTIANQEGTELILSGGEIVDQDAGLDVWLSDYPSYANPKAYSDLTVFWSTVNQESCSPSGDSAKSALEVIVLWGSIVNPSISKYVYDGCGRIANASVPSGGSSVLNTTFNYSASLPQVNQGLIMRVIPIYNSTKIAITSSDQAFPSQGKVIESVGESGETVRKVQYFSSHPQIPLEIFPYSLISQ